MTKQDWWVAGEKEWVAAADSESGAIEAALRPYRLYRFLTDLEDILERVEDDRVRLSLICPLVQRLLVSSDWLQLNFLPPDPTLGWSVVMLYDEPDFPITIQTVAWSPGSVSPIHNHAAWGIVALLSGQEHHRFWQRSPTPAHPDRIQQVGDRCLNAGEMMCLMPEAIHQVTVMGNEPTVSFNLYGATNFSQRFEFDCDRHTAQLF